MQLLFRLWKAQGKCLFHASQAQHMCLVAAMRTEGWTGQNFVAGMRASQWCKALPQEVSQRPTTSFVRRPNAAAAAAAVCHSLKAAFGPDSDAIHGAVNFLLVNVTSSCGITAMICSTQHADDAARLQYSDLHM